MNLESHVPKPVVVVTPGYVAQCFGVHISTLKAMYERGDIPRPIRIGGHTRYFLNEVEAVLEKAKAERDAAAAK